MSATDKPYYYLPVPAPITHFDQQKLGYLEVDACFTKAFMSHGDIVLDGHLMNSDNTNTPSVYFTSGSGTPGTVNVSGKLSVNGSVLLHYLPVFTTQIPSSSMVFLTPMSNSCGTDVYVLACGAPP